MLLVPSRRRCTVTSPPRTSTPAISALPNSDAAPLKSTSTRARRATGSVPPRGRITTSRKVAWP